MRLDWFVRACVFLRVRVFYALLKFIFAWKELVDGCVRANDCALTGMSTCTYVNIENNGQIHTLAY